MRLAFNGQARHADTNDGYELYCRRTRTGEPVSLKTYTRVVKAYCKMLAEDLEREGAVDLPCGLGTVASVLLRRKPQYRGGKFAGYGGMDWEKGHRDGEPEAFGITFLPRRDRVQNLRCYGFVANRRLFQRMKERYESGCREWTPMTFNDEMI